MKNKKMQSFAVNNIQSQFDKSIARDERGNYNVYYEGQLTKSAPGQRK